MSTKKVLVALSGGVDSSVAVHLLRQQGYEVEGIILEFSPVHKAAVQAAQVIADQLDVKLHVVECHKEFEQNVILPSVGNIRQEEHQTLVSSATLPPSLASSASLQKNMVLTKLQPVITPGWNISRTELLS